MPRQIGPETMSGKSSMKHTKNAAAPMIADIFQEIYKRTASNRGRREGTQEIRRAQPVEEDASD